MTTLRPYQRESIDAVWSYLRENSGNPVVVLPTGSGKTPVLVSLAREAVEQWGGRVLILAHVKELLAQAVEKFQAWWPMAPVGLYSAGLRSRDTDDAIIVAGIQSVHRRAPLLGRFDLIIVDEAHLIPQSGDGMYRAFLSDMKIINPDVRIVGLTATPFRLDCGLICGAGNILTEVCYEAGVRSLIDQGFLSPLRGKQGHEADLSGVHSRGGDYIPGELEAAVTDEETVALACDDIAVHCKDRKAWVVFCAGVKHAGMVSEALAARGIVAPVITAETPSAERDDLVARFKAGELRALCNVNVLSVGFDAPHIDAVIMMRPTQSPGLYYQQVGRGLRLASGKSDCLVLDLAGNVRLHGPIDIIEPGKKPGSTGTGDAPTKACPTCAEILPAAVLVCSACGYVFPPPPIAKHAPKAENVQPLAVLTEETWELDGVSYQAWKKKGAPPDHPQTLCVTYERGFSVVREWVCVEHPPGFARGKAASWWRERTSAPMPAKAEEAAALIPRMLRGEIDGQSFKEPTSIVVRLGGKYPELLRCLFTNPCDTCAHFDEGDGHCHHWSADVPEDARKHGCEHWQKLKQTQTAGYAPDEEAPF